MTKEIPLIISNFNQYSYLQNLMNQWRFYYPDNPIYIVDNGSDYGKLLGYYNLIMNSVEVIRYPNNDFVNNLRDFLDRRNFELYVISDPDISIHPSTPPNFLDIFQAGIERGYHHIGFDLITDDLPDWNPKAKWIQADEKTLHSTVVTIQHEGKMYSGFKAPIDTTFAMYATANGGWQAPMRPSAWDNSVRMFKAHHLPWYLHKDHLNEEMTHYFKTCLKRDDSLPSAGRNHYSV